MSYSSIFLLLLPLSQAIDTFLVGGETIVETHNETVCSIISYHASYKPLTIEISSSGLQHALLTVELYEGCPMSCPKNSTYCTYSSSPRITETVSICTDYVYVYLKPEEAKAPQQGSHMLATLSTSYSTENPCEGLDRNQDNFCKMLSLDECEEFCGILCGILHCFVKPENELKEKFSMCLPRVTPPEEYEARCMGHANIKDFKWDTCHAKGSNQLRFLWLILGLTLGLLLFFFLLVVIYYRASYKRFGRAPFSVHRGCPLWLFPRHISDDSRALRVMS